MDMKNMNLIEYNYIFEIDNIKRALFILIKLQIKVNRCKDLRISDKRRLKAYAKDFKVLCKKLIKKNTINTFEDYKNCMQTLVLINAKAQTILNNKKYTNNVECIDIEKKYNNINKFLSFSQTSFDIFLANHFTSFFLIFVLVLIFYCLIIFGASNFIFGVLVALILLIALFIIYLICYKRITKNFHLDRITRTINKNTYVNERNIKNYHKSFSKLLNIINKK